MFCYPNLAMPQYNCVAASHVASGAHHAIMHLDCVVALPQHLLALLALRQQVRERSVQLLLPRRQLPIVHLLQIAHINFSMPER